MQKCVLCGTPFAVLGPGRNSMVRCTRCGKLQAKLDDRPVQSRAVPPMAERTLARELPRKFLAARAKAECLACKLQFEHEAGPHDGLVCPRCGGGRTKRLMGRIYAVPDGSMEALSPRVRKWIRALQVQNEWVVAFERHMGALEADLRRIGLLDVEVKEWMEKIGRLKTRVEQARDEKLAEFEKYVVGMSGR